MKTRKNMTRPHASVHFKNGQNAKNVCEKREKCMTGSRAFVHFENGQNAKNNFKPTNAKNAHENEKKYSRATCLFVFRK